MNFSTQIKQSNTDEWYTTEKSVDIIIPYLVGGGTKRSFARLIKRRAIL